MKIHSLRIDTSFVYVKKGNSPTIINVLSFDLLLRGRACEKITSPSAEAGIHISSGDNFVEALLITVIVSIVLAGLIVFGLIYWVRRQDAISNNTEH